MGSSACGYGYPEPTPTPWTPVTYPHGIPRWTPDDTRIVFERESSIYVVNVGDIEAEPVLERAVGAAYYFSPSISPDGNRVAYVVVTSDQDGESVYQISTARLDGSDARRFTSEGQVITHPVWSPNGERIAYLLGYDGLATVAADGSDMRVLVHETATANLSVPVNAPVGPPAWSPDGVYVAFVATEQEQSEAEGGGLVYTDTLYSVRADGSELHRVADEHRVDRWQVAIGAPAWSPDGLLTFSKAGKEDTAGVYISALDGSERRLLISGTNPYRVEWSSNGMDILLSSQDVPLDTFEDCVYSARLDAREARAFGIQTSSSRASWSSDGSQIAFNRLGGVIRVAARDGASLHILAEPLPHEKPAPTPYIACYDALHLTVLPTR